MYARDARHVPGFAVVYVVFGWAARAIHGKCLMLLEIFFWMTADMNNLKYLYIVISGLQMWNFVICVLIFVAIVFQTKFWSGNASYQLMLNGRSYNLCRMHRGGEAFFDSLQSVLSCTYCQKAQSLLIYYALSCISEWLLAWKSFLDLP